MPGRPGIGLAGDIAADLDTAALRVEPGERVYAQAAIEIVRDRKAIAGPVTGDQSVPVAGNGIGGKVRHVRPDAGGRIKPARSRCPLADDGIACIDQLEGNGAARIGDHRRPLWTIGEIAELVHPNGRPLVRSAGRTSRGLDLHQGQVIDAEAPGFFSAAERENQLGLILFGGHEICRKRRTLRRACDAELALHRPGLGATLDAGGHGTGRISRGRQREPVVKAGLEFQPVDTNEPVPGVTARRNVGTKLPSAPGQSHAFPGPKSVPALLEASVDDQVGGRGHAWQKEDGNGRRRYPQPRHCLATPHLSPPDRTVGGRRETLPWIRRYTAR